MTAARRPRSEPEPRYSLAEALDILATSPGLIAAATAGLAAADLHTPFEPDGWSARDILAHVRACHRTWGAYIERILDEDRPVFRAESPRSTIDQTDFLEQRFKASLEDFTSDRDRLMARLRDVDERDFARTATVTLPGLGQQSRSVRYYADRMASHEREHVRHIEQASASRRAPTTRAR
ncbi:MAG TPA: DinB family protein [Candidatus Limnocylindrales bacterium]|jgi:hypothetical protein|nr:DinB family protein [Candidatus Limnocylindrales bacterium]